MVLMCSLACHVLARYLVTGAKLRRLGLEIVEAREWARVAEEWNDPFRLHDACSPFVAITIILLRMMRMMRDVWSSAILCI